MITNSQIQSIVTYLSQNGFIEIKKEITPTISDELIDTIIYPFENMNIKYEKLYPNNICIIWLEKYMLEKYKIKFDKNLASKRQYVNNDYDFTTDCKYLVEVKLFGELDSYKFSTIFRFYYTYNEEMGDYDSSKIINTEVDMRNDLLDVKHSYDRTNDKIDGDDYKGMNGGEKIINYKYTASEHVKEFSIITMYAIMLLEDNWYYGGIYDNKYFNIMKQPFTIFIRDYLIILEQILCYTQLNKVSEETKKRYEIYSLIESEEDKIKYLLNLGDEIFKSSTPDL